MFCSQTRSNHLQATDCLKTKNLKMKKETLNQLKDFELFVERMEKFVDNVKEENEGKYDINDFDLRSPFINTEYKIPQSLEDYFEMWKDVLGEYEKFKANENAVDEMFFDLYWNDKDSNPKSAYYDDKTFWVFFDEVDGITDKRFNINKHYKK